MGFWKNGVDLTPEINKMFGGLLNDYAEYKATTMALGQILGRYGIRIACKDGLWHCTAYGITEGQVGEILGDYHGTAQEILTIALDLYVKVANESA